MRLLAGAVLLTLAACGGEAASDSPGERLEAAAIAQGLVPDPEAVGFGGAYGRGADRLCALGESEPFRVGLDIAYGPELGCTARGTARVDGEEVSITLHGADDCFFTAHFDGAALAFPGRVPEGCAALCDAPASLAGVTFDRLSGAASEVRAMRGTQGGPLCSES